MNNSLAAACPMCGRKVIYVRELSLMTTAPVDAKPTDAGTVRVNFDNYTCRALAGEELFNAQGRGERLYASHASSCDKSRVGRR